MDYYKLLQLHREPFSNSPDPDYFFQSRQHLGCMQKLELALRLKRGLNVVVGDVGTGKTTLCRQLIRNFASEDDVESYLILDPSFGSTHEFLIHIHELICGQSQSSQATQLDLKETIKQALFTKGVDQNKTVVLIIDEGQKITEGCVEILRELLNFETNTFKLLQIVIFAQLEFERIIEEHANFKDRINVFHHLAPMDFKDSRQMVYHRLKLSSTGATPKKLFTLPAMWAIYRASHGYPRKIIHLCHQSMLAMIIQNRSKAGWPLVQSCKRRITPNTRPMRKIMLTALAALVAVIAVFAYAPTILDHETPLSKPSAISIYQETKLNNFMAESPLTAIARVPEMDKINDMVDASAEAPTDPPMDSQIVPAEASSPNATRTYQVIDPGNIPPAVQTESPSTPALTPPASLGQLIVKPGDTLVGMVHRVYGTVQNRHLRTVIEANPQIEDPNRIDIGDIVRFPPLAFNIKTPDTTAHWVVLEEHQTLPSAVQRAHEMTKAMRIPIQLVTVWSPSIGLRFQLLVRGYFPSINDAETYIGALPENISAHGYVISNWPVGTVHYSNPVGSGAH